MWPLKKKKKRKEKKRKENSTWRVWDGGGAIVRCFMD